jgi:hypothetical protein
MIPSKKYHIPENLKVANKKKRISSKNDAY